jgi:hypothetical protein
VKERIHRDQRLAQRGDAESLVQRSKCGDDLLIGGWRGSHAISVTCRLAAKRDWAPALVERWIVADAMASTATLRKAKQSSRTWGAEAPHSSGQ